MGANCASCAVLRNLVRLTPATMAPSPPATEPVSPKVETSKPSSSKLENTASKPVSNPGKEISTDELDKLLAREASAFQRDVEVN